MNNDGFIVEFWEKVFNVMSKISVFYWIRKIFKNIKKPYVFVEKWVLGNLLASFIASIIAYRGTNISRVILWIINIYSILRIFEIIVYQLNVLLFDPYRARKKGEVYKIKSVTSA